MKTGLVTAISAVILFTGTILWSAFQPVPTRIYPEAKESDPGQSPDRIGVNTSFFESKEPLYINVQAPVSVEITNDFTGVELRGDTSLFKYLKVSTGKYGDDYSIDIVFKYLVNNKIVQEDSTSGEKATMDFERQKALRNSNVVVRIGINSKKPERFASRHFSFQQCKKVRTLQPLQAAKLWLSFVQTDSAQVNVQAGDLTISFPEFAFERMQWIKLEGECGRVAAGNFSAGTFDAADLKVHDFYMHNLKSADVRISASHLARIRRVEDCKIQVEGNPEYEWIEKK